MRISDWSSDVCSSDLVMLGMAKGGLAGVGALATPLAALVLPPATAAALLLPVLIVQDVISVWSFRKTWDGWIIAWMLPGAALGILAGWFYAERVDRKSTRLNSSH